MVLPTLDPEAFNRATDSQQLQFDQAEMAFERIVSEYPDDSESYWNLVLCRYGIEYVKTGRFARANLAIGCLTSRFWRIGLSEGAAVCGRLFAAALWEEGRKLTGVETDRTDQPFAAGL